MNARTHDARHLVSPHAGTTGAADPLGLLAFGAPEGGRAWVRRRVRAGQYLYRAGEPFQALYLIHAGFFKTSLVAEDGREKITGFRMRGELLGVEAVGLEVHAADVVALDAGEVWELPYPPILRTAHFHPELQARITAALAAEIRRDRAWMLALGTLSAEQRVAAFLIDLADRHAALGFSPCHIVLRTTRAEIGSFLSLTLETVTRALSHLREQGWIEVERREVRLLDRDALLALIGRSGRTH